MMWLVMFQLEQGCVRGGLLKYDLGRDMPLRLEK